jgi:membrane protein implicated in regulation of membrane protease activity
MVKRRRPGRLVTILAVGFLALDGVLLIMAGLWSGRWGLSLWGMGFALGAVAVWFYWRRYLRGLRELHEGLETRFRELQELMGDSPKE